MVLQKSHLLGLGLIQLGLMTAAWSALFSPEMPFYDVICKQEMRLGGLEMM